MYPAFSSAMRALRFSGANPEPSANHSTVSQSTVMPRDRINFANGKRRFYPAQNSVPGRAYTRIILADLNAATGRAARE